MTFRFPWKIFIYILLGGYVGFVAICVQRSLDLMDFVLAHPEKTNFSARELKGWLGTSAAAMPAILSNSQLKPQNIIELFTQVWDEQDLRLEEISGSYRGDPGLMAALKLAIQRQRKACALAAMKLGGNCGYADARMYFEHHLDQHFLEINTCLAKIIDSSYQLVDNTRERIRKRLEYTLYASIFLGILLLAAALLVERRTDVKNRQIINRERMFNILSQSLDEVFIIADAHGIFHYVSPGCERVIGSGAPQTLEQPGIFYDFLAPAAADWLKNALRGAMPAEKRFSFAKNGRFYSLQLYPMENPQSEGFQIIVLNDDTERERIERHLKDALENARVANAAKSMFIARMARELGDPVNSISGLAAVGLHRLDDRAVTEESLREIAVSASHILFIINDISDISSMASGKLVLTNDVFNMHDFIRDLADKAQPYAQGRDQSLEVVAGPDTDAQVSGDTARLRQILVNLLSNAIKYTPPEGAILLNVSRLPDREGHICFRFVVSDSGPGMSEEFLDRLFVPFERANNEPAPKNGDVGLGMPVTYNLVTLMGGAIAVKSVPGEGTEVTADIPFDAAPKWEKNEKKPRLPKRGADV